MCLPNMRIIRKLFDLRGRAGFGEFCALLIGCDLVLGEGRLPEGTLRALRHQASVDML